MFTKGNWKNKVFYTLIASLVCLILIVFGFNNIAIGEDNGEEVSATTNVYLTSVAPGEYSVFGQVTDAETNLALSGVEISFNEHKSNSFINSLTKETESWVSTTSDSQGNYSFIVDVMYGELSFSKKDYENVSITLTDEDFVDGVAEKNIKMNPIKHIEEEIGEFISKTGDSFINILILIAILGISLVITISIFNKEKNEEGGLHEKDKKNRN